MTTESPRVAVLAVNLGALSHRRCAPSAFHDGGDSPFRGYMPGLYPSAKECFLSECAQPIHTHILTHFRSNRVKGI